MFWKRKKRRINKNLQKIVKGVLEMIFIYIRGAIPGILKKK